MPQNIKEKGHSVLLYPFLYIRFIYGSFPLPAYPLPAKHLTFCFQSDAQVRNP